MKLVTRFFLSIGSMMLMGVMLIAGVFIYFLAGLFDWAFE